MATAPSSLDEDPQQSRWQRRDRKRRPRMHLHGQGMKKLAARLGEKSSEKKTGRKRKP